MKSKAEYHEFCPIYKSMKRCIDCVQRDTCEKGKAMVEKPKVPISVRIRADQLEAMHEVIRNANDEDIYMSWILTVPDEPTREDFESLAGNDTEYNHVIDRFIKLVSRDGYRV